MLDVAIFLPSAFQNPGGSVAYSSGFALALALALALAFAFADIKGFLVAMASCGIFAMRANEMAEV